MTADEQHLIEANDILREENEKLRSRKPMRHPSRLDVADCDDVLDGTAEDIEQRASEATAEVDYLDDLLSRQHAILTGVANALRGDPGPLASHSHHDLAERASAAVAESARRSDLLDDVAHAHERDVLAVWAALGNTHEPPESLSAVLEAIARLREELAAAQEIVAGRKMAPTDAEVEAHERVRGLSSAWLCVWEGRIRVIENSADVRYVRGTGGRPWWPLDATGRPCAWPKVAKRGAT